MALVYFAVIIAGSRFVRVPSPGLALPELRVRGAAPGEAGEDMPASRMVRRPAFLFFFVRDVITSACGLLVISNAAPLADSLGLAAGAGLLTGITALGDGFGRVVCGLVAFDRFGREVVIPCVNLGFILAVASLVAAFRGGGAVFLTAGPVLSGFKCGCLPICSSAVIRAFHGLKNYSLNFSLTNLNLVVASFLGPFLSWVLIYRTGGYQPAFLGMIVLSGLGLFLVRFVSRP
jgi:OFA family oxalate/formate antiporter-like MFS transporter